MVGSSSSRLVADTDTTVTMTTASRLNQEPASSADVLEKRKKALQTMATEKQIVKEAKGEFLDNH